LTSCGVTATDKLLFPLKNLKLLSEADGDTVLVLILALIILKEKGDTFLVLALLYILT